METVEKISKKEMAPRKGVDLTRHQVTLLMAKARNKRMELKPYMEMVLEKHAEQGWDEFELTGPTIGLLAKKAEAMKVDLKRYLEITLTRHAENPVSK